MNFLHFGVLGSIAARDFQFNYLTGGGNYNGSQLLKTESYKSQAISAPWIRMEEFRPGATVGFCRWCFCSIRNDFEGVAVGWDYLGHWRFEIGNRGCPAAGHETGVSWFRKRS